MTADNVLFEIKGLKKNFGDLEVLKGIHTTIRKGEVVVVIGPSGSGKSTFIRCLNLLETPTEGQIILRAAALPTRATPSISTGKRWGWCSSSSTCSTT